MRRRGVTLLETMAAIVVLTAATGSLLQIFRVSARQRQAAAARETAVQEAANLMEKLHARPWTELTPEAARGLQLSAHARQTLPGGALEIHITSQPDEPGAKRIAVSIRWQGPGGKPPQPVRLVAWKYRRT